MAIVKQNNMELLEDLIEALIYKFEIPCRFIENRPMLIESGIKIRKEEETFFSIKTLDPDKMPDNVLSWKHEHGILIEDGKVEYYKDGSLIFEENMTMQQVYEKFTLDHVLNLFRSIDNLF